MKKLSQIFVAVVLAILMTMSSAMAASGQYEVDSSKLNFRAKASSESESIARLSKGTVVTVVSTSDGWAKAHWDGKTGYLALEYLSKVSGSVTGGKNTTKLSGKAYADGSPWLFKSADTDSNKIMQLWDGAELSLRGETVNFYYVKVNGETGYVLKSKTESSKSSSSSASSKSTASEKSSSSSSYSLLKKGDSGDAVKKLQRRLCKLNYLDEDHISGKYDSATLKAVRHFQLQAGLDIDGVAGKQTQSKLFSSSAPKKRSVVSMNWNKTDVSSLVAKRGGTATIVDVATGTRIKIRRVGGSEHMDVEPATASDTEKLLRIYGGEWSWDRRAVILITDGKYVAASINGMPHGSQISRDNNFEGQFCLHTEGSHTHGSDKVDSAHQSCVRKALDYFN